MTNTNSGTGGNINISRINDSNHLIRRRISALLSEAVNKPLVTVCAGAGYGKTRAVSDFVRQQKNPVIWMQFSELDNIVSRFWESFTDAIAQLDVSLGKECRKLGFPDTKDKATQVFSFIHRNITNRPCLIVIDDFHLAREPVLLRFIERLMNELPADRTTILICRELPGINIEVRRTNGLVSDISETDLIFTENELSEYFKQQGLPPDSHLIHKILNDTKGWTFAVNLVAQSLKRFPNYFGYVEHAVKKNIFRLMESENWDTSSERLKRFITRLSLVNHLSAELVEIIAGSDEGLMDELRQQSAYIRFDSHGSAYLIHHLYLDFLHTKQNVLTEAEKRETYKAAADWCFDNDYMVDALAYYEKIGDYEAIASIIAEAPSHFLAGVAQLLKGIFERAPQEAFDRIDLLAPTHVRLIACIAPLWKAVELMEYYEKRFDALPENDPFRKRTMGAIYYIWGLARLALSTRDDRYDFDQYFAKMYDCLGDSPIDLCRNNHTVGPWASPVGSARAGAMEECIEAMTRSVSYIQQSYRDWMAGEDDLARGEFLFYQDNLPAAELFIVKALNRARKAGQHDVKHRALFYIIRIAVLQSDPAKAVQALKDMETQLNETEYYNRFYTYDVALGWYYYILRDPSMFPDWLKEEFAFCPDPIFLSNFGNQIRARHQYLLRNYPPLLDYISELKQGDSILYGRIEMLAMEACVHYQMKNKELAWSVLREAYEAAASNDILMPFIELGKDMRTLVMAALRNQPNGPAPIPGIPRAWLEKVRYKATSYAKSQSALIAEHKNNSDGNEELTAREHDILRDLYNGLSPAQIKDKRSISINTVRMNMKNIYEKLNVHRVTDLVRVVAEQKLV